MSCTLDGSLFFFCVLCYLVLFFFFQAEDGIRDHCVTGVQTCALPICSVLWRCVTERGTDSRRNRRNTLRAPRSPYGTGDRGEIGRASCREKCRSRWSPDA